MLRNNINKEKMNAIDYIKTHKIKFMGTPVEKYFDEK